MAKKSVRKKLKNKAIASEKIIYFLYQNGFLQSTIVHTIVLLIMALIVVKEIEKKPIKINLSFASTSDQENLSLDRVLEFPKTETQEESIDVFEQQNNSKIVEALTSVDTSEDISIKDIILDKEKFDQSFIDEIPLAHLNKEIKIKEQQNSTRKNHSVTNTRQFGIADTNQLEALSKALSDRRTTHGNENLFANNNGSMDIGNRLALAGAKTGDIQISIAWNTTDDIDLHVGFNNGAGVTSHISWMNRFGHAGGMLDVDMNANPTRLVNKPVENVFWPKGGAPYGEFIVSIHNFRNWSGLAAVPVMVVIVHEGKTTTYQSTVTTNNTKEIVRFKRIPK
jgi:hypothetical protein